MVDEEVIARVVDTVRRQRGSAAGDRSHYSVISTAERAEAYLLALLESSERRPCLIFVAGTQNDTLLSWMAKQYLPHEPGGSLLAGRCFYYAIGEVGEFGLAGVLPVVGNVRMGTSGSWQSVGLAIATGPTVDFELSAFPGSWRIWLTEPNWRAWRPETGVLVESHADFPVPNLSNEVPVRFEISPDSHQINRLLLRYRDGRILWAGARREGSLPTAQMIEESIAMALLKEGETLQPAGFQMAVADARGGYGWAHCMS